VTLGLHLRATLLRQQPMRRVLTTTGRTILEQGLSEARITFP
jgi:hypothetical protein